ncbi:hypothetical protein VTL71DRAFT_12372 [Oculimacula yallundae]|uniref:Myb-like domain-containing protein n=1 Tax=Oculimacula yallundae TaxID=86028 RepID=A0ABR4CME4_9HELO
MNPTSTSMPSTTTKKRGPTKAADGEIPSKKSKAADTTGVKRSQPPRIPECWAEFKPEDKLIVNMRREGKKWDEIEPAWTAITGTTPGKDSLRKKYAKLEAVAQDFNGGDLSRLVAAKKAIDAEFNAYREELEEEHIAAMKKLLAEQETALKKQESKKWGKISNRIKTAGGEEYKAIMIEKKWKAMEKNGEDPELCSNFMCHADNDSGDVDIYGNFQVAPVVVAEAEVAVDEDRGNVFFNDHNDDEDDGDNDVVEIPATKTNSQIKQEELNQEALSNDYEEFRTSDLDDILASEPKSGMQIKQEVLAYLDEEAY